MLAPQPRSHEAPSRGKNIIPQQARSWASSWSFPSLSYDINCQRGGGTPSTCTWWSARGTAWTARRTTKASTGSSVNGGGGPR